MMGAIEQQIFPLRHMHALHEIYMAISARVIIILTSNMTIASDHIDNIELSTLVGGNTVLVQTGLGLT